jgi:ABC-type bacteriocin/lantibiotic exporter with double-glycine peptidase domain
MIIKLIQDELVYLINQEKHYYILQRFSNGKLYLLDPVREKPEICSHDYLKKLNSLKIK